MSYEQPVRHQRRKLSPDGIISRVSGLLESAAVVEECTSDLIKEVYLPDSIIAHISHSVSLSRRQLGTLKRALLAANELKEEN